MSSGKEFVEVFSALATLQLKKRERFTNWKATLSKQLKTLTYSEDHRGEAHFLALNERAIIIFLILKVATVLGITYRWMKTKPGARKYEKQEFLC